MTMSAALKQTARSLIPSRLEIALTAIRARQHSHHLNRTWGLDALGTRLVDELGSSVRSGPFAGLTLPREALAEHIGPYLLGTYERELHSFWESLTPGDIPLIVNVGSKVGYYATGLSRKLGAPAMAYDADPWARRVTRATAALNARVAGETGGARVTVRGVCTRSHLHSLPAGALVVIDCDGGEEALLKDPVPDGLRAASIVLELHGPLVEHDEMADRLRPTHDVRAVPSLPAPEAASLPFLTEHECRLAVEEIRTPQRWLLCTPRATA